MTEGSVIQDWDSAGSPTDAVGALRLPMRQLLEAVSPTSLETFDIIYDGAAIDIIGDIVNGTVPSRQFGGEQSAGFREHAAMTVLAFVINVAASLSVERFHTHYPDDWTWLVGNETAVAEKSGDRLDDILRRSGLSVSDQAHVKAELSKHPDLLKLIAKRHHK